MDFEKIIYLTNAKRSGGSGSFVGHCPIHGDKNSSMSITIKNEKILFYCHAGCSQESLIDYFKKNQAWSQHNSYSEKSYDKIALAKKLWDSSDLLSDNDGALKYFRKRGIQLHTNPDSVRFSSKCYNSELKTEADALVGRIQSTNGEFLGVQRIYLDNSGRKLNVESPKKILGNYSGGYVELKAEIKNDTIHLVEGLETGLAIYSALNETTLCAVSAKNLSKVCPDKTVKTIHIWADKDVSGTGQREALLASKELSQNGFKVYLHFPKDKIPEKSKGIDFLDVYVKNVEDIKEERLHGRLFNNEIFSIQPPQYHLPKIDDSYLPYILRDWVFAQSERLNVEPETIAVPVFSIIGSLIGSKLAIRPKKFDHWTVFANLWGMVISPPGTKKSAIIGTGLSLLSKIEKDSSSSIEKLNEQHKEEREDLVTESKALAKELEAIKRKISKLKIEEDENSLVELENGQLYQNKIKQRIIVIEKRIKEITFQPLRYSVNAFTIEKLIDLLGENKNGLLISRDELSGLFESFKKAGHEATRQFVLEGWNGDGHFQYDLLSRVTKPLSNFCITILGGTQPSVINKMLTEMRASQNDDGFIQRFQLIAFPNQTRKPAFVDKGINSTLQKGVEDLFSKISQINALEFGEKTPSSDVCYAKLEQKSYELFSKYMGELEQEIFSSESGGYQNHINKFGKLLSGLILIFHVIDNLEIGKNDHLAKPHVVEMAIKWTDLFKAHAKKLYDTEYSFEAVSGYALAKKIVEGKIEDEATLRSIHRNCWSHLKTNQEVESGLIFLEKHNWLKLTENKPQTGRPSTIIKFHQSLLDFVKNENWCDNSFNELEHSIEF